MFSDQGAQFSYSLPDSLAAYGGFSGPFLMTQENGAWIGPSLTRLQLSDVSNNKQVVDWENDLVLQKSFASHLEQRFENDSLNVEQQLVFISGHTALQLTTITNNSEVDIRLNAIFSGSLFDSVVQVSIENDLVKQASSTSGAKGYVQFLDEYTNAAVQASLSYVVVYQPHVLSSGKSKELMILQTSIFPEYSREKEREFISNVCL